MLRSILVSSANLDAAGIKSFVNRMINQWLITYVNRCWAFYYTIALEISQSKAYWLNNFKRPRFSIMNKTKAKFVMIVSSIECMTPEYRLIIQSS